MRLTHNNNNNNKIGAAFKPYRIIRIAIENASVLNGMKKIRPVLLSTFH